MEFMRPQPPDKDRSPMRRKSPKTKLAANVLHIDSARDLGEVTVDLLDHHFATLKSIKVRVGKGATDTTVATADKPPARPIESIRIHVGEFTGRMDLGLQGHAREVFGKDPAPPKKASSRPKDDIDD
jgi:hypothetical protein